MGAENLLVICNFLLIGISVAFCFLPTVIGNAGFLFSSSIYAARFPHLIRCNFSLTLAAHCIQRGRTQPDFSVSNIKWILLEMCVCVSNYKRIIFYLIIYFKKKPWIWEGVKEIWKELDGLCKYIFHIWLSVVFK